MRDLDAWDRWFENWRREVAEIVARIRAMGLL